MNCETCHDKGFVNAGGEVAPCPNCNPDSGFEPGEYAGIALALTERCSNGRGGGGRTCYLALGHKGRITFSAVARTDHLASLA